MKKRGQIIKFLSVTEITIFLLSSFAISFIVGQTNLVSAAGGMTVAPVPVGAGYTPNAGSTFYNINFGEGVGDEIVKWTETKDGVSYGINSAGLQRKWTPVSDAAELSTHDVTSEISSLQRTYWGKTMEYNGQKIAIPDALANPDKFGLMEGGKLTSGAKDAFEKAGVNNIAAQGGQIVSGTEYSYTVPGIGVEINNFLGAHLVQGLLWSVAAVGAIQLIGRLLTKDTNLVNSLSAATFAGIMSGQLVYGLFGEATKGVIGSGGITGTQILTPLQAGLIGVGVAAVVFILLYKKEKKKIVELQCLPWEAPLGGASCEKCNGDPIKPCSEYKCKSLGQACELVNKGSNEERCVWVTKGDVNSPTITPWNDVLTKNHKYSPLQSRPNARGTTIQSSETASKCIKPFTPLQFGITTNEPSQCKIGLDYNQSFNDMPYYFGESNLFAYNHTEKLRLPSPDSVNAESPEVPSDGSYNFYVVCQDVNGNKNEDKFLINFCVDKSPDTTPPIIEDTSITSGSPVTFGTQNVPLTIYLNEPAECRWSIQDKTYNLMENNMSCSTHVYEQNAQQQYPCAGTLNGIKDRENNLFYFRCRDQPLKNSSDRNTNQESYAFSLRGSQPLTILEVGPNSTFRGGTDIVAVNLTVKTNAGSDEGKAICSFSPTGAEGTFISMFETDSFAHSQILSLPGGSYNYQFRCVDAGGNAASANTSFNVLVDRNAPRVTRVYKDSDVIKLTTDESASCTYSLTSCTYDMNDGIPILILNTQNRMTHGVPWQKQQTYYIKCKDDYGNQPGPSSCSVIASASTFG